MAAPTVSGNFTLNTSFSEGITSGVITPQNLPASVSQNLTYASGITGATLTTDTMYAAAAQFGGGGANTGGTTANYCQLPLTSLSDLAGKAISFQRVRELVIQNLNSYPIYLYGGNSSGASPVRWIPSAASGSSALMIPGYGGTASAQGAAISVQSSNSAYWPTFRICDPVGANTSSVASQAGFIVSTASCWLTLANPGGASTDSVNIMIAGCANY